MYKIKLLNKISASGLSKLNIQKYHVGEYIDNPDAILVRSADMHEMEFNRNLKAIARAGAGVNNIPIDRCTQAGIAVFNTPGANANAVKELVITGLLLSSRKVVDAICWLKTIADKGDEIPKLVEKGKSAFAGPEIQGKKLGVIGLGAIGVLVANAAERLGMEVYGYDPFISIDAAWNLSRTINKCNNLNNIFEKCDYITLHIPSTPDTRGMLNTSAFVSMKPGVRILNFARGDLVDSNALEKAIETKRVACYVTDFPNEKILSLENVIAIPHLGASTPESEDNCAAMAAIEVRDYLEQGIIRNSVNLPTINIPKVNATRILMIHGNIPNMLSKISTILGECNINIENLFNKSKKDYAVTVVDIDTDLPKEVIAKLETIDTMINIRIISK
jgi:D-3-phosphoglycerate dehydrogenase